MPFDALDVISKKTLWAVQHGDVLEVLASFPDASVDVVVTDPPAGIGFMGKAWDSFKKYAPRTERGHEVHQGLDLLGNMPRWASGFVAFMVDVWTEVDRVLKPGGFVCAWALPKTADLAGLAMRLAGWTIHESVLHLFGCLADDAEILTDVGWVGPEALDSATMAMCFDLETTRYTWQPIERRIRFHHRGPARRVIGEGVDHVVTPDHRCVDAGQDGYRFVEAGSVGRVGVPIPEDPESSRWTSTSVCRVDRVDYDGVMWCVQVPTGAFVARTNAGPFVTGNSGMNKAGDIGKQIDKAAGAEREVVGENPSSRPNSKVRNGGGFDGNRDDQTSAGVQSLTAPATDDAKRWTGWHSQIAPGHEQWLIARKPSKLTYARQVVERGCGAFNVDACRVPRGGEDTSRPNRANRTTYTGLDKGGVSHSNPSGSHPRNVVLSTGGDGCPARGLDRQSGVTTSPTGMSKRKASENAAMSGPNTERVSANGHGDSGGASRYFTRFDQRVGYFPKARDRKVPNRPELTNKHPTHKNPRIMVWLCQLLGATTSQTGDLPAIVLDPFNGSGTTGVGAALVKDGPLRYIGIERDADSVEVSRLRIAEAYNNPPYYDKVLKKKRSKRSLK